MIFFGTKLINADNTDIRKVRCIKILGNSKKKKASLGDIIRILQNIKLKFKIHILKYPLSKLKYYKTLFNLKICLITNIINLNLSFKR